MKTPLPIAASIAQRPGYGGHAWAFLQYAIGFREIGFEPIFIDRLTPEMTTDNEGRPSMAASLAAIDWFIKLMKFAGLEHSYSLILGDGRTIGLSRHDLRESIRCAPCLINVMGFLDDPDLLSTADTLVFLDVDPGFPQLWMELDQADLLAGHDQFVSVGANIGDPKCDIPTCGLEWIPIHPPVVLEMWPHQSTDSRSFGGIGSWRGPYDSIEYEGRSLGLRVHEFRKFASLPSLVEAKFDLALDIDSTDQRDIDLIVDNGWALENPRVVAGSPSAYREFIQGSGAEIAIAKNIYVAMNSGWFGDRSACFLSTGRPVLCQDTGFQDAIPSGEGLIAFSSLEEAVEGAELILADWPRQSREARALAEATFDSRKVLGGLLEALGVT